MHICCDIQIYKADKGQQIGKYTGSLEKPCFEVLEKSGISLDFDQLKRVGALGRYIVLGA